MESKRNCFAVPEANLSTLSLGMQSTLSTQCTRGQKEDTLMTTMTSQLLQIIFNTDARVPSLPLIKATWLSFDFSSQSFFRSPLTLRGSRVGLLVGKRCALMQILMRSRRLSCTCAKYPAIGRVGCVSLPVGQTGRWRHMLLFDKPFISKGRMEELEMPKSVLTCFEVNKLALQ